VLAVVREEGAAAVLPPPAVPSITTSAAAEVSRLKISPFARELARNLGVDPSKVQGTGRGGAITREDIEKAAAKPPLPLTPGPSPPEGRGEKMRPLTPGPSPPKGRGEMSGSPAERQARMRQAIAAAMARSKREIPHYYLSTTIDMHRALTWLSEQNEKRPITDRLLPGVLLVKAVALALRKVPELNSLWEDDHAVPKTDLHVGMAIAMRQGGLIAPALHHADRQSLDDLMKNLRDVVDRTRSGGLRGSEMTDATITVTSLGDQGVESLFGIIVPPQVAIVGFGAIMERPWVVDGKIVPRPVLTATLSADHRVSDGHRGAIFLAALDRLLQEPAQL
jgi:pyruvate dehydrogenase E2 component (dihydrolipoamide acetyltransferase)